MTNHFLRNALAVAALIAASPTWAQEETTVFELTSSTFSECTQQVPDYDRDGAWRFSSYSSVAEMWDYNVKEPYYDDYLLTPGLDLEAGTAYTVSFTAWTYSHGTPDHPFGQQVVWLGQGDDLTTFTQVLDANDVPYGGGDGTDTKSYSAMFTVPASGKYKVALEGKYFDTYVRGFKIVATPASACPAKVSNLVVIPGANGAESAVVSFTLPTQTITFNALEGELGYKIMRDGEQIAEGTGTPGQAISYADNAVATGEHSYAVTVTSGQETSAEATIGTYIGVEMPVAPADVVAAYTGGTITLSWTAPTVGAHGAPIPVADLRYNVYRLVDDGEPEQVAENLDVCAFAQPFEPQGIQKVVYAVEAVNGAAVSAQGLSNVLTLGSMALPFAHSFAGGTFGNVWEAEVVGVSTSGINWMAVANGDAMTGYDKADAQDGDGGLAYFCSYQAKKYDEARLMTMPLSKQSSTAPVVEFYLYGRGSNSDALKLQVSLDGGDWTDVEGTALTIGNCTGWTKYSFSIADAIAAANETYRVGFLATSDYGYNTIIDAVRIYNLAGKDLQAVSLEAPQSIKAGNNLVVKLNIANNGGETATADNYSVELTAEGYADPISQAELPNVPAMGTAEVEWTIPVNTLHKLAANELVLSAKIVYHGDEAPDNNESEAKTVALEYSLNSGATNLAVEKDAEGNLLFSWTAPEGADYEPLSIAESFEDCQEPASADEAPDVVNGFTVIDLDGENGGVYYNASGAKFAVTTVGSYSSVPSGVDGSKALAVTWPGGGTQNDWIVSPALNGRPSSTYSMSFKVAFKKTTSSTNKFEVLYATEDFDAENPAAAFTHVVADYETAQYYGDLKSDDVMHLVENAGIPATAKYIAIHFKSDCNYQTAVWVDDIKINEEGVTAALGYRVYSTVQGPVNTELIPADQTSHTLVAAATAGDQSYFVTAVYPDGEAQPSNMVKPDDTPVGIHGVTEAESQTQRFNLQGQRVNKGQRGTVVIERQGEKLRKVMVK